MEISQRCKRLSTELECTVLTQAMASAAASPEGAAALAPGDRVRVAAPTAAGWGAPANAPTAAVSALTAAFESKMICCRMTLIFTKRLLRLLTFSHVQGAKHWCC